FPTPAVAALLQVRRGTRRRPSDTALATWTSHVLGRALTCGLSGVSNGGAPRPRRTTMADQKYVKITRIYTGEDERPHFGALWLPREENPNHPFPTIRGESMGFMGSLPATEVSGRVTPPGGDHDFHWSPGRALQFTLSGRLELELGDGSRRQFGPGDSFMLDEQGRGQGHRSHELAPRVTLNVRIDPDLDLSPYRIAPADDG